MSRRLVWPKPSFTKKEGTQKPVEGPASVDSDPPTPSTTEEAAEKFVDPFSDAPSEPPAPTADPEEKVEPTVEEAPKPKEKAIWKRYAPDNSATTSETKVSPSPAAARIAELNEKTVKQEPVSMKSETKPAWAKRVLPVAVETATPFQPPVPSVAVPTQESSPSEVALQRILGPALEQIQNEIKKMKRVVSQKFEELEGRLDREEEARAKITAWIRTNIGPSALWTLFVDCVQSRHFNFSRCSDLEKVREVAREEAKAASSSSAVSESRVRAASAAVGPPKSVVFTPPSFKAKSSAAAGVPQSKNEDEWTDGEDDVSPRGADHPSVAPAASKAPRDPRVRSRRITRVAKLNKIEEETFGVADIERFELPVNDASGKVSLSRANYFLTNQQHAANQYRCKELYNKVSNFVDKGGQVLFVPLTDADRKKDAFSLAIRSNDKVFPICPDGLNRSQVLYLALLGLKRVLGMSEGVQLPHGARCGCG